MGDEAMLDAYDRALAAAEPVVGAEHLERMAGVGRRIRRRLSLLEQTVLVAVAGGTGSGKSSLINAIVGTEVLDVGPLRPTTAVAVALIPSPSEPGLALLLDQLGVVRTAVSSPYPWLALIDLPDTDSVMLDHRSLVDRLLPHLDAVLWVLDPEKYRDRLLFENYLRPLATHRERFWYVLNHCDRLAPPAVKLIVDDLTAALMEAGDPHPMIFPTAADPPQGPPLGIEPILVLLEEVAGEKELVRHNMMVDLREGATELSLRLPVVEAGPWWEGVRRRVARLIGEGKAGEAGRLMDEFLSDLEVETGVRVEIDIPSLLEGAADETDVLSYLDRTAGRILREAFRPGGRAVAAAVELITLLESEGRPHP
jgi:energy-coupling factor transporter ATP-binding protein EcfA2